MSVIVGPTVQAVGRIAFLGGIFPEGQRWTMKEVFPHLFSIFLVLGTAVGIVVLTYMVYVAFRYRADGTEASPAESPQLGELPTGGGGGRKLAVSLTLSAIIVIALISYAWVLLQGVEAGPSPGEDPLEVTVIGERFSWQYIYPNGNSSYTLRVPDDRPVRLTVTSSDVMHTYGIPAFDLKTDAIPAQNTTMSFDPDDPGTYQAVCFELCGTGHSQMNSKVIVMEGSAFEQWYATTTSDTTATATATPADSSHSVRRPARSITQMVL